MSSDINEEVNHRKRRRNRMRVSCLNCYASKRKCDRKRPCTRCVKHGLTGLCVYELDDPDTRDPTLDETAHLRNRIAELESVIRELNNRPHPRWFAPNGIEHIPELVATRRPSTSNSTGTGSSQAQKACKTPSRHSARNTSTTSNDVKAGSKRKHELSLNDASFKKSRHASNSVNDDEYESEDGASAAGRQAYGSDNSYCTDEDDDEDDEDYEEYRSRSRPKAAASSVNGRFGRVPAKQAQAATSAYNRSNDAKSIHSLSRGASLNTFFHKPAGAVPSSQRTSSTSTFTSTSTSRSISISSNPPSAPFSPAPPEGFNQPAPQSALGLIFDALTTDSGKSDYNIDASLDDKSSPPKRYSLRGNVVWNDQSADHDNESGVGTGSFTSSTSRHGSKPLASNSSRLESRFTRSTSVSTQASCQKQNYFERANGDCSAVRHGRYIDTAVQTLGPSFADDFGSTTASCSCLSDAEVRNEITFLIVTLGDISNVLKAAHSESRERQTTAITHKQCELLRRIVELDEYFSRNSANESPSEHNRRELNVVAFSAVDDTEEREDSSSLVPGDRLNLDEESNPPDETAIASQSRDSSKSSKTRRQLPGSGQQGRKRRSRTWSDESRNSTTPSISVVSDTANETSNVPATAAYFPAPTPASILERSLSQLSPDKEDPAQTDTLASVLAGTLNAMDTGTVGKSDLLITEMRGPPRFLRTPDPTPVICPTPTFSPSSPILRPTNSAMRRPDADFLPFYSYAAVGCGENHDDAERGPTGGHGGGSMSMVTSHHHHHHLHHDVSKIAPGLERVNVTTIPAVGATVVNNHAVSIEPAFLNNDTITVDVNNANMGMDLDVDAEGEPAPESGYQYAYFEDGYRYEYVCIDDA